VWSGDSLPVDLIILIESLFYKFLGFPSLSRQPLASSQTYLKVLCTMCCVRAKWVGSKSFCCRKALPNSEAFSANGPPPVPQRQITLLTYLSVPSPPPYRIVKFPPPDLLCVLRVPRLSIRSPPRSLSAPKSLVFEFFFTTPPLLHFPEYNDPSILL